MLEDLYLEEYVGGWKRNSMKGVQDFVALL